MSEQQWEFIVTGLRYGGWLLLAVVGCGVGLWIMRYGVDLILDKAVGH